MAIVTSIGSINRPACVTLEPKPNPAAFGICMNCGTNAYTANIAAPNSSATRFVVQTAGSRIIRMSISGFRERSSTVIQATSSTTAVANNPIVNNEPQPQDRPALSGSSSATNQPDSNVAASQSIRPGTLFGDSGT